MYKPFFYKMALSGSTEKFRKRFMHMEQSAAEKGTTLESMSKEEMGKLWNEAKEALD